MSESTPRVFTNSPFFGVQCTTSTLHLPIQDGRIEPLGLVAFEVWQ